MDTPRQTVIQIGPRTIITAILLVLLVVLLYMLRDIVLLVLTAIVIASAIEPFTKKLAQYKVPRALAVLILYALIIGGIVGVFYAFVPTLLSEASNLLSTLPQFIDSFDLSTTSLEHGSLGGQAVETLTKNFSLREGIDQLQGYLSSFATGFWGAVRLIFGGVLSFVLIVVLSFYFAVQETGIDDFLRVVTPLRHQKYVINLWRRSQHKIGLWMQGQLLLGLIVAVLTYLGLMIIGVKYALLLSIAAGFFELIPLFGIVLALIPAVAIAFADGGVTMALLVLGLYLIIQQFENHLIYPLVVKKVVGVPALLVILGLIIGGKLAGFLGIILSVPMAAALQEFVSDIERRRDGASTEV